MCILIETHKTQKCEKLCNTLLKNIKPRIDLPEITENKCKNYPIKNVSTKLMVDHENPRVQSLSIVNAIE